MTPRKRIIAVGYSLNADKLDDLETSNAGGTGSFVPVTSNGTLVLGSVAGVADPSGVNGMVVYNVGLGKLRCYEGGAWTDCVTAAGSASGWTDSGTTVALITASDNVGIGTGSPTAKLHVSGTMIANGGQMDLNTSGTGVTNIGTGGLTGNVTLGNSGNSVRVGVSFVPTATNSFNLGADATNFSQLFLGANGIAFEGSIDDGFETALNAANPTADRIINFPDASGNVLLDSNTAIFTLAGTSGSS